MDVCPAHAGVYRWAGRGGRLRGRLPRTRGGLPSQPRAMAGLTRFAPHTRGSTALRNQWDYPSYVCPAHAGVYPTAIKYVPGTGGLPRTRGGLPSSVPQGRVATSFAPHTRGSTAQGPGGSSFQGVCPAHAGVYLDRGKRIRDSNRLPHTRGGLPLAEIWPQIQTGFAPHTRGSTYVAWA